MKLDINKICKTPNNQFEANDYLIINEQNLIEAFHLLEGIVSNPEYDYTDKINLFLFKFTDETKSS